MEQKNKPKSLQELQANRGISLNSKDKVYLRQVLRHKNMITLGEKLKYLRERRFLNSDNTWTALGQAAVRVVQDDQKRAKNRSKEKKKVDRTRHEDKSS